ncbi:NADH-quinone oxidoreductase subunit H [Actinomadura sp. KC345]|uniref:NADH-quinone oxidoreductase subunit H n=1 Tax=Actinomadura sp. KC345 TaxID=2530371 RepID=UPI0010509A1F|nr:NADH-quinone oxidoreductase subunit H [Actinomadura sp. KC345]TDC52195.1 NADH-quinone oxidoreductase subunit H [Actinomadura sp. KC345]
MAEVLVLGALAVAAASLNAAFAGRRPAEPFREAARLLTMQRRVTVRADMPLARIGVISLPVAAALAALVVPVGEKAAVDSPVGVVWFNAMEVVAWASVWLAGWGVNSAFALVGGYRFLAQGLAYELPHMFALITAGLAAHSLDLRVIGEAQDGLWFAVWMPVAFAAYLVSALAMAFWGPFGHPVGGDLAGGAALELPGPDRLVFLAGRYGLLTVSAAVAVPLFLGGGSGPLLPGWAWSLVKTSAVLALLVWTRHRLPVLRMDRFMTAAWTVLIPATLLQMLVVGLVVV